jgi:predicted phage-related endonuclease
VITYHRDLIQGSDEWLAARCGMLTASEMRLILTPTLKTASNAAERAHVFELAAQRITKYVEPTYIGDEMLRGYEDEILARNMYSRTYEPVTECGFVTNDKWGFTLGCSPDGLVGDDGMIECKSRRQKFQIETITSGEIPAEFSLQIQTELLVTGRDWCDFISYSGGLPMVTIRAYPDPDMQDAIIAAATAFELRVALTMVRFGDQTRALRTIPTERRIEQEMFAGDG